VNSEDQVRTAFKVIDLFLHSVYKRATSNQASNTRTHGHWFPGHDRLKFYSTQAYVCLRHDVGVQPRSYLNLIPARFFLSNPTMSKRRPSSSSSSSSTPSLINVSFDFFNPNPKVDYHALTRLLSQLFSRDAEHLQIPSLVELILAQPKVGTTIKTGDAEEGEEGDPYAVLSVVNVNVHLQRGNGGVRAVVEYVLGKAAEAGEGVGLCEELKRLLTNGQEQGQGQEKGGHVGLVICERLVNMPVQVVPPMYRMLVDEIDAALRDVRFPLLFLFFNPPLIWKIFAGRTV
jgi:hypothetical protein